MKILFITANRLGDAVLSTGVLHWLVTRNPGTRITIVCGPYAAGLFRAVPGLERIVVLRKKSWNRHWFEVWTASVSTRWDIVVDLRNSIVSRLLITGELYAKGRSTGLHKVIENANILKLMPPPAPHIWLDAQAEQEASRIMPPGAVLVLGPAANWPCKQWPVERFAALAQKLTAEGPLTGASVLVVADEKERAGLKPLLDALPDDKRIELFGRDLLTVAACLKRARFFVGNDSGLMHMAVAVGTPTLGLFGPGYEEIYGPWGPRGMFVRTDESREELLKRLPRPGAHEPNLMMGLSVEKTLAAVQALLTKT